MGFRAVILGPSRLWGRGWMMNLEGGPHIPFPDAVGGGQTSALRNRTLTVVAQDPGVHYGGGIVTALLRLPYEELVPGPIGHRVQVVDYDASTGTLYRPATLPAQETKAPSDERILRDPAFHAQN